MDEIKKQLVNITEKLATNENRIVKMEITIYGAEGHGGIFEKIESIEKTTQENIEATKKSVEATNKIEKTIAKGLGFIAAIAFLVPIILKFIKI